jgi:hypothetical protein
MEYDAAIVKAMMTALFNQPGGRDQFNHSLHVRNKRAMRDLHGPGFDGDAALTSLVCYAIDALRQGMWRTLASYLAAIQICVHTRGM